MTVTKAKFKQIRTRLWKIKLIRMSRKNGRIEMSIAEENRV